MPESKQLPMESAMTTVSGVQFTPFDPSSSDVRLQDIAHGLANLCRASGQTQFFYSVGLHSIYVSQDLAARGHSRRRQLIGLLHDAQEAYINDLVSPVKAHLKSINISKLASKTQCGTRSGWNRPSRTSRS
ncbi:hypothetical protein [Halovenus salina]|uniref:HD domain-containing protein n=1 Tax=Halovenus salina TaxID=1510225 RepID=A0ABD5W6T1_9EURY